MEDVEAEVSADSGLMTDVIQTIHQINVARSVTCHDLQNLPEISLKLIEGKLEEYVVETEEEEVWQVSRLLGLVKPEEFLSNEQLSHGILRGQAISLDFLESCDLINHWLNLFLNVFNSLFGIPILRANLLVIPGQLISCVAIEQ